MSEKIPQTYANHSKLVPLFHFVLFGILVINFLMAGWNLVKDHSMASIWSVVMAFAYFLIFFYIRIFPLTVQDRLIRLEMKLRLQKILPAADYARVDELKRHHFVALRFAPDAELPELFRRVIAGELRSGKEIKSAIKTWNPDYLRC